MLSTPRLPVCDCCACVCLQFQLKLVSLVQKLAAIETEADINLRKKIRKLNHRYNDLSSYLKIGDGKLVSVESMVRNEHVAMMCGQTGPSNPAFQSGLLADR